MESTHRETDKRYIQWDDIFNLTLSPKYASIHWTNEGLYYIELFQLVTSHAVWLNLDTFDFHLWKYLSFSRMHWNLDAFVIVASRNSAFHSLRVMVGQTASGNVIQNCRIVAFGLRITILSRVFGINLAFEILNFEYPAKCFFKRQSNYIKLLDRMNMRIV